MPLMNGLLQPRVSLASLLAVGALASALGVAVSLAGAHGGDAEQVHACVRTSNGSVRIVAADTACSGNETARDWAIAGPQGEPGPAGPGAAVSMGSIETDNGTVSSKSLTSTCPPGTTAISAAFTLAGPDIQVTHSLRLLDGTGWLVAANGPGGVPWTFQLRAVCIG